MNGTNSTRLKFFKINSKGKIMEGIELKVGQRMFINKILDNNGSWLYQVGWGDREYIRLFDILRDGKYFEWDKELLNEMRKLWLVGSIFNSNGTTTI